MPRSVNRMAVVLLWVVAWELASELVGNRVLLAGPIDTLARLMQLAFDSRFLAVTGFSLTRVAGGFVVAYVAAVALSFATYRWPVLGRLLAPGITALKSIPIACIIVLLLIWVGSRRVSGIAVFLAVFPAVYFSCREGLAQVDEDVSEMLAIFRVRRASRLLAHVWPQVLPYLVGTSKNVCGMAWKAGVAAELIGSPMGSIGERIYQAKILLETADLFAWTIVVVILSAICERVFVALLSRSDRVTYRLALELAHEFDDEARTLAPSAVQLDRVTLGYDGVPIVREVSLDVAAGARTVFTDASGAGKTTMLRSVAGLQPLLDGEARVLPPAVTMVFQDARLIEELSAVQNVTLILGRASEERVRKALLELLDEDVLNVPVGELSGGQRRRVEIVRALICPGSAVLLDEPFSSLDEAAHARAAAFVLRHLGGRTLLVASHAAGDAQLLGADELRLF